MSKVKGDKIVQWRDRAFTELNLLLYSP